MSLHKGNIRDVLLRVAYLYREAPEELKDEYAKVVKLYIAKANEILGKESETEVPPEAPPPAHRFNRKYQKLLESYGNWLEAIPISSKLMPDHIQMMSCKL